MSVITNGGYIGSAEAARYLKMHVKTLLKKARQGIYPSHGVVACARLVACRSPRSSPTLVRAPRTLIVRRCRS